MTWNKINKLKMDSSLLNKKRLHSKLNEQFIFNIIKKIKQKLHLYLFNIIIVQQTNY